MEGLGAAASAIAVIELAAKVGALCLQYSLAVKNAKQDIEQFRQQIEALKTTAESAQRLLQRRDGVELKTLQNLRNALASAHSQLDPIRSKLEEKLNAGRIRRRTRLLKWPFETKDVDKVIANLQRYQATISAAVLIDQTPHILDIHSKTDKILEISRKTDLPKLPVSKGAAFHDEANEHDPSCHPATRVDLLSDIYRWIEDPNGKGIFWLRGMAGTGKSTISRTVAKELSEAKVPSASFFFKKGQGDRGRAAMFFTTILDQLLPQLPALAPHIQEVIEKDPAIVNKFKSEQFEKLFLEPLDKCKGAIPGLLAVVVDALDECDQEEDATALIRLLSRAKEVTSVRLRFFITSRPELPIRFGFKKIDGSYQDLALHDVPEADVRKDISTFLRSELAQVRHNFNKTVTGPGLPADWPPSASLESLVDMAVPLFIFASTACRFISSSRYRNPMDRLDKILEYKEKGGWSQLHTTYLPILNELLLERTDSGLVSCTEDDKAEIIAWFREVVGSIVLLADPLPISSLAQLLGRPQMDVDSGLRGLHSVLDISDDPLAPVKLLHLSFRDFLVDRKNRDANPFWVDTQDTHERLADRCLELLSTGDNLKRDVCGLRLPGTLRSEISQQTIDAALPPEIQYACRYWVHHWKESKRQIQDRDLVYYFLTDHLLHWLEALGVIGRIWESIGMIDNLLGLLHPEESTAVSALLRDVRRVILNHCSVINTSPLQIYCSALVFAPEESVVRKMFRNQFPIWLSVVPQVNTNWDACLQTLEGHSDWVNSVAFAHDGTTLASASDDGTIKLWDTATGNCRATLEGHSDPVNSVVFARSKTLASGSVDGTVKLWDTATSNCRATLKCSREVTSVAFARSKTLASGSTDGTVKLWDTATGDCQATLEHGRWVSSVAFTHDGKTLASGSHDHTIKLWDVTTGDCQMTLKGHSSEVSSVTFTQNSKLLASASLDGTIKLWDIATGDCQATLDGHSSWFGSCINSIALAHDGKTIASGSRDETVKLWNIITSDYQTPFKGHNDFVRSVIFARNGKTLASASEDQTIKLWDTATGNCRATLKGHSSWVISVVFTRDSKMLASASQDRTVKLWDTATGNCQATLEGHSSPVSSIAFTYNSKMLVSAYDDGTIKLWDIATGNCQVTFNGHGSRVTSIAFTRDGKMLASACNEGSIKLWDTVTSNCRATLKGHSHYIRSLVFTHDGKTLASASSDRTIKLWDTATGDCQAILDIGTSITYLAFNSTSSSLFTNIGTFSLNHLPGLSPSSQKMARALPMLPAVHVGGIGISDDGKWVTWGLHRVMWLPPAYRSDHSAITASTLAIGCSSGRVVVIAGSPDSKSPSQLAFL